MFYVESVKFLILQLHPQGFFIVKRKVPGNVVRVLQSLLHVLDHKQARRLQWSAGSSTPSEQISWVRRTQRECEI